MNIYVYNTILKTDNVPDQKGFRFTPDVFIHFDKIFRMSIIILTF